MAGVSRRGVLVGAGGVAGAAAVAGAGVIAGGSLRGGSASAAPVVATTPVVATSPWSPRPVPLDAAFGRGMTLAHLHQRGWGYGSARSQVQAAYLAAIGVRDVAINPFAYVRTLGSTQIHFGGDDSMTDDDVRLEIAHLRAAGHRVMMKPHLWSWAMAAGKGNNDITLEAAEWQVWFASYTKYIVHYARMAAESGCDSVCVGLEYTGASRANPGAWAEVARAVRGVFPGKILYAANWYQEWEVFADWDAFDLIGINAYFPLTGTSVDELVASWQPHLDAIEKVGRGRPVVFPEAGYRAVGGATEKPWLQSGGSPDGEVQARAYEALLRACTARPWFRGVWWWKWFTNLPGEGDAFVPAGNPAEEVIKAWFGAGNAR